MVIMPFTSIRPFVWVWVTVGKMEHTAFLLPIPAVTKDDVQIVRVHWEYANYPDWVEASSVRLMDDGRRRKRGVCHETTTAYEDATLRALDTLLALDAAEQEKIVSTCQQSHKGESESTESESVYTTTMNDLGRDFQENVESEGKETESLSPTATIDRESQKSTFDNEENGPRKKPAYFLSENTSDIVSTFQQSDKVDCKSTEAESMSPPINAEDPTFENEGNRQRKAPVPFSPENTTESSELSDKVDSKSTKSESAAPPPTTAIVRESQEPAFDNAGNRPGKAPASFSPENTTELSQQSDKVSERTQSESEATSPATTIDCKSQKPTFANEGNRPRKAPLSFSPENTELSQQSDKVENESNESEPKAPSPRTYVDRKLQEPSFDNEENRLRKAPASFSLENTEISSSGGPNTEQGEHKSPSMTAKAISESASKDETMSESSSPPMYLDCELQKPAFDDEGNRPRKMPAYFSPEKTAKAISNEGRKKRPTKAPARYSNAYVTSHVEGVADSAVSMVRTGIGWTSEENGILLQKHAIYGAEWSQIAEFLPGRNGPACRKRFCTFYADDKEVREKAVSDKVPYRAKTPAERKVSLPLDTWMKDEPTFDNQGRRPRKAPAFLSTAPDISDQPRKKRPKKDPNEYSTDHDANDLKPYKAPWTSKEDMLLREKRALGKLSWTEIATFLPGRTESSCRQRFHGYLNDSGSGTKPVAAPRESVPKKANPYKTAWSLKEDKLLREKRALGTLTWDQIATFFPGRTMVSCRLRYQRFLDPSGSPKEKVAPGLKRIPVTEAKPRWTEEDLDLALRFFGLKQYVRAKRAMQR